jgi:hypothetical protein
MDTNDLEDLTLMCFGTLADRKTRDQLIAAIQGAWQGINDTDDELSKDKAATYMQRMHDAGMLVSYPDGTFGKSRNVGN